MKLELETILMDHGVCPPDGLCFFLAFLYFPFLIVSAHLILPISCKLLFPFASFLFNTVWSIDYRALT